MDLRKPNDRLLRRRVNKLLGFVMVLPILIAEFELRASFLLQSPFIGVELRESLDAVLTIVVATFIERNLFPDFPAKESVVTVGAEVF